MFNSKDILLNTVYSKGFIFSSYLLIQKFSPLQVLFFCELLTEYNYANKHGLASLDTFLIDIVRFCDTLYITIEQMYEELEIFQDNHLIHYQEVLQDHLAITLDKNNIIDFVEKIDTKYPRSTWDVGLRQALNPVYRANKLSPFTQYLLEKVLERKSSYVEVPQIIYIQCDDLVNQFDKQCDDYFSERKKNGFDEAITKCINQVEFKPENLLQLIYKLCSEY